MTKAIIFVGLGGGLGSIFRYLTSYFFAKYFSALFPIATLTANVLGCLIIGVFVGLSEREQFSHPDLKFLFITGFCGGYTTFSTFAYENMHLFQSNNYSTAYLYIAASILAGLLAVWLGLWMAKL